MTFLEYLFFEYEKRHSEPMPEWKKELIIKELELYDILKNAFDVRVLKGRSRNIIMYKPKENQ